MAREPDGERQTAVNRVQLEQAVFTSLRGPLRAGYQLAATSPGVSPELARELSHWSPAHDSLVDNSPHATSINYHALAGGELCVSLTTAAGQEYSGRRGPKIYTQFLIAAPDVFAAFENHPFRLLTAASRTGEVTVLPNVPPQLPVIQLAAAASAAGNPASQLPMLVGQATCDQFVRLVRYHPHIGVASTIHVGRLFAELFDLLSPDDRIALSFTTGLRHSALRPFRMFPLPTNPVRRRQLLCQTAAHAFTLPLAHLAGQRGAYAE